MNIEKIKMLLNFLDGRGLVITDEELIDESLKEYEQIAKEPEIIDLQGINEDLIHVTITDEYGVKYTGALEKDEIQ